MSKFNKDATDEQLLTTITDWVNESQTYYNSLVKSYERGLEYHQGKQTDRDDIPDHNSNTVYNRIYEGVETLVPIISGSSQQFIAMGNDEDPKSKERARKIQKALSKTFEEQRVKVKLQDASRAFLLGRYGVLEWGWDYENDDVGIWYRDPRSVLVPKIRGEAKEAPYVILIEEFEKDEFEMFFPDEDVDDFKTNTVNIGKKEGKETIQVLVALTPTYRVYTDGTKILKKMMNPYFDFTGMEEVEETDDDGNKTKRVSYSKKRNFLKKPTIPLIFFAPMRTSDEPFPLVSPVEVVIPIQDDINTQKRQITNNIVQMGNGQWLMDADVMSDEEEGNITNEPGLILKGKNLASENRMRKEQALPLPQSHFANLQDSLTAFDNVFGVNAAIRGASNAETLGGQILNRQQSLSRIDQLSGVINDGVTQLAHGVMQLYKMFYDKEHVIRSLGEEGAVEMFKFSNKDIEEDVVLEVKSGTPISLDPQGKFNQAIQLWQLQAIDPETLYERLDFPNPQLASQKLAAWRAGQLVLEAQITGQAEAQRAERDVETPNDATQRATDAVNGQGKAPLSNTPNQ